jgi:hypothetical protein
VATANAKFIGKIEATHAQGVDSRQRPHYRPLHMFKLAVGLFFFQHRSVNQYVEARVVHGQETGPVQNTIAYYLEQADVRALNLALWDQAYTALRLKQLDTLRGMDGRWSLAFDGVSLTYSTKRCCEKCLTTTTKDGVISYHHAMLVASIVDKVQKASIVVAVIPIENAPGTDKQACELKATKAMLDHLRKMNPYIRYHITVDGLYLSAGFIDQAVKLGHTVTMPLAKENMTIHEILDVRFGNGRPSVQCETVSEKITVAYEAENIAPFWNALHEKNPDIALFGIKRTIIDKATGEIRECPIVTTIAPTAKNALSISDIQREKWQEENKTFNDLKNHHHLKHIFNHKAQAQVFIFASLATNMRTIYLLRHPPQCHVRKPLSLAAIIAMILKACDFDPIRLLTIKPLAAGT